MLPKSYRLPGYQIPQILKTGRWFRGELFDLIIKRCERAKIASDEQADFRPRAAQLTVIIPQRLCKKSTKRHRAKRLLVEAVHQLLSQIKPGRQIILMAKKILEKEKLQDIMPEVEEMLRKTGIIKSKALKTF